MKRPFLEIIACALMSIAGCSSYTTTISVKDPARVSLNRQLEDGSLVQVIPPGRDSATAIFWSANAALDMGMAVKAFRTSGGALCLECKDCAQKREEFMYDKDSLIGVFENILSDKKNEGLDWPNARKRAELDVPYSYTLATVTTQWATSTAYGTTTNTTSVTPVLSTPWDNVKEVKRIREMNRAGGLLLIPGTVIGGLGIWALSSSGGNAAQNMVGWLTFLPGLGIDLFGVYCMIFPSPLTQVLYPEKQAIP